MCIRDSYYTSDHFCLLVKNHAIKTENTPPETANISASSPNDGKFVKKTSSAPRDTPIENKTEYNTICSARSLMILYFLKLNE